MTSPFRASAACAAVCLVACATGTEAGSNRPGAAISVASDASVPADAGRTPPPPSEMVPDGGGGGSEFPPNPGPDGGPTCLPRENCNQPLDLDCDGQTGCADADCAAHPDCVMECTYTTERCDVGGCNGSLGDDYAACMAEGNPGGCTDAELYGWCTRRVTPGPGGAWYEVVRRWVDDRCSGTITMGMVDGYEAYVCRDEGLCREFVCTTPLVLALDGLIPALLADSGTTTFDLSAGGDGSMTRTDWVPPELPWLALDRDGDGRITSGRELFGSATLLGSGDTATDGFAALSDLDDDHNGVIDSRDAAFALLVAWYDRDSDRESSADELVPITELGIAELSLDHEVSPECDARGNCAIERSAFGWADPSGASRAGALVDVHLAVRAPSLP